jgi:hypothetical protein
MDDIDDLLTGSASNHQEEAPRSEYLIHFGVVPGLKELDPDYMGTSNVKSAEAEATKPVVHRTYFYRENTQPEDIVTSLAKTKYFVKCPEESKLYDLGADKDSIVQMLREKFNITPSVPYFSDFLLSKIKSAGYLGFYNSNSALPNVVALFYKVPVEYEEPAPSSYLSGESSEWLSASVPPMLRRVI